jgi:hypothetical protein
MNISKSISGLCIISILMSGALVFCSAADEIVDAFQYDDPQELDLQIEHVKGGDTTAFLSPVNTLQAALDLDMVDLIEPTFAWGSAKNLVSMFQEGSVGLPKDREKEAVLNIRFKDSYTGGRTLESLVFVIGGDIGNRNLYDFDMLYSAVQTPSDFVHFFSAQDKGPNAGMTGHANKNPGAGLRVSGFKEQVRDVHTLRIVIRSVTGIATSYMKITADFDSGPAGNSIEKRLGKLGRIERPLESEASASLMFTDKKIHTFSQGMGWNLYMHDGVPGPAAPWWDTFFNLLEWAGCEWVRVPVHFSEWEPENDNDDPFEINWSALRFDQGKLKNEIEIWRRVDQRGIDVLLGNWKFMTRWMSAMAHNNPGKDIGDDWFHTAPYSGEEIGESYEIEEGLVENEIIVTNGAFTVDAAAQLQGKKSMMNNP